MELARLERDSDELQRVQQPGTVEQRAVLPVRRPSSLQRHRREHLLQVGREAVRGGRGEGRQPQLQGADGRGPGVARRLIFELDE